MHVEPASCFDMLPAVCGSLELLGRSHSCSIVHFTHYGAAKRFFGMFMLADASIAA